MKTVTMFLTVIVMVVISSASYAHSPMANTKTESFKVWGNCGMCKERIEKAAKIQGVTKADWNQDSKKLTLVYDPSKVTGEAIQKKIAAVGHDTEKFKGDEKAYAQLPGCCKYERKK